MKQKIKYIKLYPSFQEAAEAIAIPTQDEFNKEFGISPDIDLKLYQYKAILKESSTLSKDSTYLTTVELKLTLI